MYNRSFLEYGPMQPSGSSKVLGLRKGAWTAEEDMLLKNCIEKNGDGKWHLVPLKAGLNRCRKSCRLRWLNYLRPNIKRGHFDEDEVDLILRLHKLLGNRWSLIAGRIPGRTANDVKNYWNTHILRSRSKQQNDEPKNNEPSQQNAMVNVIKPQPVTYSKTLNCDPPIPTHDDSNLLRSSNNGVGNAFTISTGLISLSGLPNDKIQEYVDELFTDVQCQKFDSDIRLSFDYSPVEGGALDVVGQEDDQTNLFDFHIEEAMWDFLDSDQLSFWNQ